MKIIGRIICKFKGHKRGVLVTEAELEPTAGKVVRKFRCPRCDRETVYKQKPLAVMPNPLRTIK